TASPRLSPRPSALSAPLRLPFRRSFRLVDSLFGGFRYPPVVLLLGVLHPAVAAELVADLVELVLVEDHLVAALPGELVDLGHEDRLLGADLLAVAAEDATQHVDV